MFALTNFTKFVHCLSIDDSTVSFDFDNFCSCRVIIMVLSPHKKIAKLFCLYIFISQYVTNCTCQIQAYVHVYAHLMVYGF